MSDPFVYPSGPLKRRHGPRGYADYQNYRPWLRDEFSFRCVYCLLREQWGQMRGGHAIDHFLPVVQYPKRVNNYDNLVYACGNRHVKGTHIGM
jgi:5-methylcytosine-specific restriction endonuclease McrA